MARVVVFDEFGGPDVLRLIDERVIEPGAGEVRVKIEAFAVNPLDVMMRSGSSPAPVPLPHARLGVEATGVIDSVGQGVDAVRVGDPVIVAAVPDASARGTYAEYTTLPARDLLARPDGFDVIDAAAVWVGFSTAYGALVELAGMRPGHTVLVTGASGGVGRAAIQIAAALGAIPLAVTRDPAKAASLRAIGADAVIVTERDDLAGAVRRRTDGRGVDIALDVVRGPGQQVLLEATRTGGTLVAAGFLDTRDTPVPADGRVDIVGYRGFDYLSRPDVVARMADFLRSHSGDGELRAAIDSTFDLDRVVDAHRRFDSAHAGKIIVTV
jgi:NADPH:quinone reductase-like Zn-dependent oxidoreductase